MNVRRMGFCDPIGPEVTVLFGWVRPEDIALVLQDIRQHPERHFHNCSLTQVLRCSSPSGTVSKSLFMAHRYHAPVEYCSYCQHAVPKKTIEQHCEHHQKSDRPIRVYFDRGLLRGGQIESNGRRH